MINLRLPSSHPDNSVIQRWAQDKEKLLDSHVKEISRLKGIIQTILTNNPDLVKSK